MRKLKPIIAVIFLLGVVAWWHYQQAPQTVSSPSTTSAKSRQGHSSLPGFLPAEAKHTLALIAKGGPYPYRQDNGVFGNREKLLPRKPRGYYHEYTVVTPGARNRGARRIITGGNPPKVYYYTSDHYRSFRSFEIQP